MSVDLAQVGNLIVSIATLATALNAIRLSNYRKEDLTKTVQAESKKVQLATDGIVDKLVEKTATASRAEGVLQEKNRVDG